MLADPTGARCVRLTSWGNAVLSGQVGPDDAADAVVGADSAHRVAGLPGETGPVAAAFAFGRLRSAGARAFRLALPVPGDPLGIVGPPALSTAAVAARGAVLAVGAGLALVPAVDGRVVRWDVVAAAEPPAAPGPLLAEAERALREALVHGTEELVRLDVARWGPEAAQAVAMLRATDGAPSPLAPGYSARAVRVFALAARVLGVVALAGGTEGAAVTAGEAAARAAALAPLGHAGRRALVAACNSVVDEAGD